MSLKDINRLQVLVALSGFIPGLISIYTPTWFFFQRISAQNRREFLDLHPEKRNIVRIFEIFTFSNILTSPVISVFFIQNTMDWMKPFMLFCFTGNSIAIMNGLFEILTGICPTHGISFRAYHREYYLLHPDVRKAGLVRVLLGVSCITLFLFLFRNPAAQ